MYNKIVLVGNLTRDIETRHTQAGLSIANTAIATSRKFKGQSGKQNEEVMFIDISFFGRTAEVAQQYLKRGSKILVEGRVKLDQWVDQNGQKRSKHSVTVETMQMLDGKNNTDTSLSHTDNYTDSNAQKPTYNESKAYTPEKSYVPEPIGFNDEDIPF
ncbi:single-stranded DNA-binding protein [Campylobacterota bacterium]